MQDMADTQLRELFPEAQEVHRITAEDWQAYQKWKCSSHLQLQTGSSVHTTTEEVVVHHVTMEDWQTFQKWKSGDHIRS